MPKITPISYKLFCKVLKLKGFILSRQKGDHLIFIKPGLSRPLVIPMYDNLPIFVIKNNLKTAGLSRDEYFELLNKK